MTATVELVSFPVLHLSFWFNRDVIGEEMKVGLKEALRDALRY